MRSKFIAIFALMLCVGAFLLPVTAHAATETTPPTVTAKITGDILRIEAADTDSGVEAVFINDKRVNYRVDGALELDAKSIAGDGEKIAIYAVDFAGNQSAVIEITNPYFEPSATPEPTESAVSAEPKPFTPAGQASVVDEATESDGKDFYSFTTPEGNVFYLVIDHQRNTENVYFLNAVNEDDLMALAEKSDKTGNSGAIPTTEPKPTEQPTETEKPAETPPPKESGGNSGMIIFVVLALAAAGGAGYYFKILRPKQQAANASDDSAEDEYGEDEDYESEEDEDEPEDEIGGDDEDGEEQDE